jgi:transposase
MRDKELYAEILGIRKPWFVEDVELRLKDGEVLVKFSLPSDAELACPECGERSPRYDSRKRRWRHLDTCQYKTIIEADIPRVKCKEHGIHQIKVPWAEPGSRFTLLMEKLVIDWLKEGNIKTVAGLLGLSWDEVDVIMKHAVERGMRRREEELIKRIGVDETSFKKRHEYVTTVTSLDSGNVLYAGDGRGEKSLDKFYEGLSEDRINAIETVCMDMWDPYISSTRRHIPNAESKIAFDKFHVAKHLGDAVDRVRREEHKTLSEMGRDDLKKTRFMWLMNPENMPWKMWVSFKSLRESSLKTAKAWMIKEIAMNMWDYRSRGWALKGWTQLIKWAKRSRLEPVIKVILMIENYLYGIINAILMKVSNGIVEGINSKIQKIKARACGYRNRQRFINAIYFYLGGLDLYPRVADPVKP